MPVSVLVIHACILIVLIREVRFCSLVTWLTLLICFKLGYNSQTIRLELLTKVSVDSLAQLARSKVMLEINEICLLLIDNIGKRKKKKKKNEVTSERKCMDLSHAYMHAFYHKK